MNKQPEEPFVLALADGAATLAVVGGKGQREEAQPLKQLEHVVRVLSGAIDLVGARRHLVARHAPDQVLDGLLLITQFVARGGHGFGLICEHNAKV